MTNITAKRIITTLTIQCAWLNRRGMSRLAAIVAAVVDAAEKPGIMHSGDNMALRAGSNAALLFVVLAGCDDVTGGAVELSWKLRPASSSLPDKFVDCESGQPGTGPVTDIRLHWEAESGPGDVSWRCDNNHGVTGFDLPPGPVLL